MSYIGNQPKLAVRQDFTYVATAGQTVFTGADSSAFILNIDVGNFDVFINGIMILRSDIASVSSSSLTLNDPRRASDIVVIRNYGQIETIANVLTTTARPILNTATWQAGSNTTPSTPSPKDIADEVIALLNASGSAPLFACRAWVRFNGTGTVAINGSGNVSSITDLGTGTYQINFTTAMSSNDYCAIANATQANSASLEWQATCYDYQTTSVKVVTGQAGTSSSTIADNAVVSVAIFG
ncbi:putative tail fiber protein [Rhizobium phage RHph_I1_18]|nr:putative tail fiber protein [Rhizobium phage RHph_I1_18]